MTMRWRCRHLGHDPWRACKPGYVWLHDDLLSDDATRARLTGWALDCVRDLPPKE